MDSTGRTYEDFLKEPHWNASDEEWDEVVKRQDNLEKLDTMAGYIEIYRRIINNAVYEPRQEIYIKCQMRWMQRYIKLAESIF